MSAVFEKYSARGVSVTEVIRRRRTLRELSRKSVPGLAGRLSPKEPISLYLHALYQQMCGYCGTKLAARDQVLSEYVGRLIDEIDLFAEALPAHLHFGGAHRPALPPPRDLEVVLEHLTTRFATDMSKIALKRVRGLGRSQADGYRLRGHEMVGQDALRVWWCG